MIHFQLLVQELLCPHGEEKGGLGRYLTHILIPGWGKHSYNREIQEVSTDMPLGTVCVLLHNRTMLMPMILVMTKAERKIG